MRISDWSSDVCSSDLLGANIGFYLCQRRFGHPQIILRDTDQYIAVIFRADALHGMDRLETLIGNENAADTAVSSVGAALDISARFQAVDQPADRNLPDIQLPRKVHLHHTFISSTREPRQNRPLRSRSEEQSVGKECVSTCGYRWAPVPE